MNKICSKCKGLKSIDEFYRNSTRTDGLASWCKDCLKLKYKNNRKRYVSLEFLEDRKIVLEKWIKEGYIKLKLLKDSYEKEKIEIKKREDNLNDIKDNIARIKLDRKKWKKKRNMI